jgi:hypothetical protein
MRTQSGCWGLAKSPLSATESPCIRLFGSMEQRMETGPIAKSEKHVSVQIICCGFTICNLRTRRGLAWQNRTEGSNPLPSATQSGLQRKSAPISPKYAKHDPYFAIIPRQTGLQRTDCSAAKAVTVLAFLWRAHAQSGFEEPLGECNAITKRGFGPQRVDFC